MKHNAEKRKKPYYTSDLGTVFYKPAVLGTMGKMGLQSLAMAGRGNCLVITSETHIHNNARE